MTDAGRFNEIVSLGFDEPVRRVALYGDSVATLRGPGRHHSHHSRNRRHQASRANRTVVGSLQLSGPLWGELVVSDDHAYVTGNSGSKSSTFRIRPARSSSGEAPGAGGAPATRSRSLVIAPISQEGWGFASSMCPIPADPIQIGCTPAGGYGLRGRPFATTWRSSVFPDDIPPKPPWIDEVRLFDLTDETAPVEFGSFKLWGTSPGLAIDGDLLFIAVYGRGLLVMDVSDPRAPEPVGLARVEAERYRRRWTSLHRFRVSGSRRLRHSDLLTSPPRHPTSSGRRGNRPSARRSSSPTLRPELPLHGHGTSATGSSADGRNPHHCLHDAGPKYGDPHSGERERCLDIRFLGCQ